VYGCTNSEAFNFDPSAYSDDESCTYDPVDAANLFFSEYARGSSENYYSRYLEIYNPTDTTVFLFGYAYPSVSD
jgi:hypothetical protein